MPTMISHLSVAGGHCCKCKDFWSKLGGYYKNVCLLPRINPVVCPVQ